MDNLRKSLIILFQEQNPAKMLDIYIKGNNGIGKNKFFSLSEREDFISQFSQNHKNLYNKDEIKNICSILTDDWSRLSYSKDKNIFNVVAKFSTNVLKEWHNHPVCQQDKLFKWREVTLQLGEDLFTTAFLAYNDLITGKERNFFTWKSIIGTDDVRLQEIFKKGMAENHFHLNGSSPHFQLAWISLMNKPNGRGKEFKNLKKNKSLFSSKNSGFGDINEDIESLVKKAAIIRIFLFEKFIIKKSLEKMRFKEFYNKYLMAQKLENRIITIQYLHGKIIDKVVPDYAISKNVTINNYRPNNKEYNGMILLYGERVFLYQMFKLVFNNDENFKNYQDLLYIYLCIKQKLRNEIIQLNKVVGFANFGDYQDRKEIFISEDSIYSKAIVNIAINSSLIEQNIKYLETRIAPKQTKKQLKDALVKIEAKSKNTVFFENESLADRILNSKEQSKAIKSKGKYFHTIHFIKKEEEDNKAKEIGDIIPRNHFLRKKIKIEASAINELRKSTNKIADKIYGIDAANIEIGCRPEVFAHIFRYIKNYKYYQPATIFGINYFHEIGQTFHAGEDFLDLLDGMRAIDEVLRFFNFSQGDRLGHALAIGIDPKSYYRDKEYTIILSKQNFLDNIVWALCKKNEYGIEIPLSFSSELENLYKKYYNEIYFENVEEVTLKHITFRDYYEAWKLRGDSPYPYLQMNKQNKLKTISYSFWEKCRFNESSEAIQARKDEIARNLYKEYHFNEKVKKSGKEMIEYKINNGEYIRLVKKLQIAMQEEIARKNIYIETNPTSNILIGPIEKYIKHPILRFNNYGLITNENSSQISVSINTDDQGVFATSLENEYALMALALLKQKDENGNYKYNQMNVYEWLDKVRQMSLEHSFENICNIELNIDKVE